MLERTKRNHVQLDRSAKNWNTSTNKQDIRVLEISTCVIVNIPLFTFRSGFQLLNQTSGLRIMQRLASFRCSTPALSGVGSSIPMMRSYDDLDIIQVTGWKLFTLRVHLTVRTYYNSFFVSFLFNNYVNNSSCSSNCSSINRSSRRLGRKSVLIYYCTAIVYSLTRDVYRQRVQR